ncbi:DNA mismatch repair endonuclease MutL [Leptothoe kymatousa]|uniref:DNA mismatch repair protein MutL n=1 Tax=Leptothoe kymatousa TAU-MAC 1615 TaxID=2364775 RepID=A0ABS5Y2N1_9CYAN|nr:DNA mismatch repair endonuclease MutL [Leptothoe kymatousa TAU-MAC 1615]
MTTDSIIQRLSQEVISLIAAGEVIDSLSAVVRELSENALDAGATRITIHLWPEIWRVRVTDNGAGIVREDLEQAATAHSTSKIRTCDDLSQIHSLGFRGEALHSLAQLSELEIRSRGADGGGWRVVYDAEGMILEIEEVAIAPGTVVTANNLFARLPNRRQVLPSVPQQLRQVQQTVQQLALCHPQVTWQVAQGEKDWFTLWPGSSAKSVLPQLLRDVAVHDLEQISLDADELGCHGQLDLLVGLPDRCHRRRPDWVRVAINGRTVTAPILVQSLIYNFRRTLPRDRYPVCFLHLQVPAVQVDWNRNPAKSEIYLQDTDAWCDRIAIAVEKALRLSNLADDAYTQRTKQLFKTAEAPEKYGVHRQDLPSQLKAVAQVQDTYIVAEHPGGVCLVEQHIAHERVLYERIQAAWQTVPIEPAIILSQLTSRQVEQLRRLSLDIDLFGENLWAVRTVPVPLANREDCAEALLELSLGGDVESAMVATACRTAIRNGTPLELAAMQELLEDWQRTKNPRTCPHGRPICLTLEESSLSRYFRRHWVIGKSHGLRS